MGVLLGVNIDLSKITQSKVFTTEAGRKYYKMTVAIDDETKVHEFQDGKLKHTNVNVWEAQDEEERKAKSSKNFLGDGQVFWMSDDANVQTVDRDKLPEGQTSSPLAQASAGDDDFHF